MVKVIKYVDKCDECPYQLQGDTDRLNVINTCLLLKIETVDGFILEDCPFDEVECPDHHSQELA
jgi:hypothetical protein